MNLELVDADDAATVAELVSLHGAARTVDRPYDPPQTAAQCASWLRNGDAGEPPRVWLLRDEQRRGIASVNLSLPERDNTHLARVGVLVHPDHRRRGHGTRLLQHAREQAAAAGRRLLTSDSLDSAGPVDFAEAMGFTHGSLGVQRRQHLAELDHDRLEVLLEQARAAATDYRLLRFVGTTPEEHVPALADLTATMNDAPTDDLEIEDEVPSPERLRAYEQSVADGNGVLYRLIAQREADAAFGGFTVMVVNTDQPEWAFQNDTGVARDHRGHRLGLLLKLEMLRWLAVEQPQVRWLDTWNAASNAHMIAINEDLGYRIVAQQIDWQREI